MSHAQPMTRPNDCATRDVSTHMDTNMARRVISRGWDVIKYTIRTKITG